ncbi:MAG: hypothetical protein IJG81_05430 [Muribaculaceae bacterium]|nr:hypothetical protein [Muribaculaceae bacterium]
MNNSVHPLHKISLTAEEKPFTVTVFRYKFNEKTDKFESWNIKSEKTTTYYAVLWHNIVFIREKYKQVYKALCGRSINELFEYRSESEKSVIHNFPFCRNLPITDDYLVVPSRINNIPITDIQVDNCKSRYLIIGSNVVRRIWFYNCDNLEYFIGEASDVCIFGINKLQYLKFMKCEAHISSESNRNRLKEILISCQKFGALSERFDTYPLLLDVYSLEKDPPECYNLFQCSLDDYNVNTLKYGTLHVPQGAKRYYQVAYSWNQFQNIVEFTQEEINEKLAEYERKEKEILDEAYKIYKENEEFLGLLEVIKKSKKEPAIPEHLVRLDEEGLDLAYLVDVAPKILHEGGKIIVPTLDGKIRVTIPSGTINGHLFRVRGKGLKNDETKEVGDFFLLIHDESIAIESRDALEFFDKYNKKSNSQ